MLQNTYGIAVSDLSSSPLQTARPPTTPYDVRGARSLGDVTFLCCLYADKLRGGETRGRNETRENVGGGQDSGQRTGGESARREERRGGREGGGGERWEED